MTDFLPTLLNYDLRYEIFSYLGGEKMYWKDIFSKIIISQLDPQGYFTKHILPEIDQGWQQVGVRIGICYECYYNKGFRILNPYCDKCYKIDLCQNCYWYNTDPYNLGNICECSDWQISIKWKDIMEGKKILEKYPRYKDFQNGDEWQSYLERCANVARERQRLSEMTNMYRNNRYTQNN